jgi:ribosomal protein L37AE/L43A
MMECQDCGIFTVVCVGGDVYRCLKCHKEFTPDPEAEVEDE